MAIFIVEKHWDHLLLQVTARSYARDQFHVLGAVKTKNMICILCCMSIPPLSIVHPIKREREGIFFVFV
jgi:hypothetical protein